MAKISVIIPIYNTEKYLAEALDSVLQQTFQDFEIICINDGNTDKSAEILAEYAKKDSRIKVITQKNQGVITARNNAIKEASGEFLYTLDSDDIIDKTIFEKSYNAILSSKGDIITCLVSTFGENNYRFKLPYPNKMNMSVQNCLISSALFKKSLFDKSGGFDPTFDKGLEDYDFWLNMIYRQKARIYRIPETLFFYRIKPISESRNKQSIASNTQLMALLKKKYPEMKTYEKVRNVMNFVFKICHIKH